MENFEKFINELPELDSFAGDYRAIIDEELKNITQEQSEAFLEQYAAAIFLTQIFLQGISFDDFEVITRFVFNVFLLTTCPKLREFVEVSLKDEVNEDDAALMRDDAKAVLEKLFMPYSFIMLPDRNEHKAELIAVFLSMVEQTTKL